MNWNSKKLNDDEVQNISKNIPAYEEKDQSNIFLNKETLEQDLLKDNKKY